jgi:hypothetical protein
MMYQQLVGIVPSEIERDRDSAPSVVPDVRFLVPCHRVVVYPPVQAFRIDLPLIEAIPEFLRAEAQSRLFRDEIAAEIVLEIRGVPVIRVDDDRPVHSLGVTAALFNLAEHVVEAGLGSTENKASHSILPATILLVTHGGHTRAG